jgi:TolB protein
MRAPRRAVATHLGAAAAALLACGGSGEREDPCQLGAAGARWVAFSEGPPGHHEVGLARADGTCARRVSSGGDNLFPSFSPRGALAFSTDRDGGSGLRIHELATGVERALEVGALLASAPSFSPAGGAIAFEAHLPGEVATDVYVLHLGGGPPARLTDDPAFDAAPAWSPDGAVVYFVSDRAGAREVFAVPAAGGAATQITTGSGILGRPAPAPDGAALAWARASGTGGSEVVVLTLATGALRVVTSVGDSEPAFDPAGGRLAVRTLRWGVPAVAVVDAGAGGNVVRLTAGRDAAGSPAFSP